MSRKQRIRQIHERIKSLVQELDSIEAEETDGDWKPGIVVDCVVITATTAIGENGEDVTRIGYHEGNDGAPHYRLLGLVDFVRAMLIHEISDDDS